MRERSSAARQPAEEGRDWSRRQAALALAVLLAASLLARAHHLTRPLAGHFAQYQALQGMMARNLERDWATWSAPKTFIVQGDEAARHLLYLPIASLLAAAAHSAIGGSLDFWGRFQALAFFPLACVFLYRLVRLGGGRRTAVGAVAVFCLAPVTFVYAQQFQNEMATVCFLTAYVYFLLRWVRSSPQGAGSACLAGAAAAAALLLRLHLLVLAVPTAYVLARERARLRAREVCLFLAVALAPPTAWTLHGMAMEQDPLRVHSRGLLAQLAGRTGWHNPMLLKADFIRRLAEQTAGMVLGPFGLTFTVLGAFRPWRGIVGRTVGLWLAAGAISVAVLPAKAADHDFYLMLFLPPACAWAGSALSHVLWGGREPLVGRPWRCALFFAVWLAVTLRYAWNPAFVGPPEQEAVVRAALEAGPRVGAGERVVVNGPAQVALYYMDREGFLFPSAPGEEYLPEAPRTAAWKPAESEAFRALREAFPDPVAWLTYTRRHGARYFLNLNRDFSQAMPQAAAYLAQHASLVAHREGAYDLYAFTER